MIDLPFNQKPAQTAPAVARSRPLSAAVGRGRPNPDPSPFGILPGAIPARGIVGSARGRRKRISQAATGDGFAGPATNLNHSNQALPDMIRVTVLLAILLLAPLAAGQASESRLVLEDGSGDVTLQVGGAGQPAPGDHYAYLDLVSLEVQEDRDGFTFALGVVDLNAPTEPAWTDGGLLRIEFTHADQMFRLELGRCFFCIPADYTWSTLYSKPVGADDWSQQWERGGAEGPTQDGDNDVFIQRVLRSDLRDTSGAKPATGRAFTDMVATSLAAISTISTSVTPEAPRIDSPAIIGDRMPDNGGGTLPIQFGVAQTGHARLVSDQPMRASNGEATTFIYTVTAKNVGPATHLFELETMGVPDSWNVILPVGALELGPGEERQLPVLVATPFRHLHGAEQTFHLHMKSTTDRASIGRIELGVIFNEVPQPAGHHSQVWFHSRAADGPAQNALAIFPGNDGQPYMNALAEDENDAGIRIAGFNWGTGFDPEPVSESRWFIPLDPGLLMGLDFDLNAVGSVEAVFTAGAGLKGAELGGRLILLGPQSDVHNGFPYNYRSVTSLANLTSDGPVDFGPGASQTLTAKMHALPVADFIPYDPANNLVLELRLQFGQPRTFTAADAPYLEPGGSAILPLLEYHDPIDDVFDALDGPILRSVGAQQRLVNPGATALFEVQVENARDQGATYNLALTGSHVEWASIVGPERLKMTAAGKATVTVAVKVPAGVVDGELVDLVLSAEDHGDPTLRGLIRLVAEVDTDATHGDEAEVAAAQVDKDAPGPGLVLAAVALTLVALRRKH